MKFTGAELIIRALEQECVTHGFGIPGTHNIELYDELAETAFFSSFLVTDEQGASFMADGFARVSGRIAVVNVVPGAGLTHALSGIAEAFMDQVPMLVLSCGIRQDTGAAFQLHDIDQVSCARPVCKKTFRPRTHPELYRAVREAVRIAVQPPCGPTLVEVPANLYLFPHEMTGDDLDFRLSPCTPPVEAGQVEKIVAMLNASSNVALYAGAGAVLAGDALVELADKLDAVVFTTIAGKGVFPEQHPRFAWNTLGAAAPPGIRKIEGALDCVLAVGLRFGEVATASYGFKPPRHLIHVDIDAGVFNRNYPANATLQADAGDALKALLAHPGLAKKSPDTHKLVALAIAHADVRAHQSSNKNSERVTPAVLFGALAETFGNDAVYVADSGNGLFLAMEHLRLNNPRSFLAPIDYSCMGYSVPAAIGAKLASPERPVVALTGDGAFLMTGMELITAANYGVGAVFIILRDGELGQISQFQRASLNRETMTRLFELKFDSLAHAVGIPYFRMDNDRAVGETLAKAAVVTLQRKPVLIECNIDYGLATYFSKGVIKTNFLRFPWRDRFRLIGRVVKRKLMA